MSANLVINNQHFVLIIDELGKEKWSQQFICQLLRDQEDSKDDLCIKTLTLGAALKNANTIEEFLKECNTAPSANASNKWNVLLPPLSDFLIYQPPAVIFRLVHELELCAKVKRTFLWLSKPHLLHAKSSYIIGALEYLADLVLHFETTNELSICMRKPGGGVTNKRYNFSCKDNKFAVSPLQKQTNKKVDEDKEAAASSAEQLSTFKIELEEDELMARNSLKMPYEKTSEEEGGNIIYTPDAEDDFDEEDPDEDLNI